MRQAIFDANFIDDGVVDTITFDPTVFGIGPGLHDRIELDFGQLAITDAVTIDASAIAGGVTIDANDPTPLVKNGDGSRVFSIAGDGLITLRGLTLTGGDAVGDGGAILTSAPITLDRVTLDANAATQDGGALHVDVADDYQGPALSITASVFDGNRAGRHGGAVSISNGFDGPLMDWAELQTIDNKTQQTFLVESSRFTDNRSGGQSVGFLGANGGALYSHIAANDEIDIVDSVVSGNSAGRDGGGVYVLAEPYLPINGRSPFNYTYHEKAVGARVTIARSVIDNNDAANRGGGVYTRQGSGSTFQITESTVSGNTAAIIDGVTYGSLPRSGGGVYAYMFSGEYEIDDARPIETDGNGNAVLDRVNASVVITDSTISGNVADINGSGVAICAKWQDTLLPSAGGTPWSAVSITNSTISGNTADHGGGVYLAVFEGVIGGPSQAEGLDTVLNGVTVTENRVRSGGQGGGIRSRHVFSTDATMDTRLVNTIVAGNHRENNPTLVADNYYGTIHAAKTTYSLFGGGDSFFEFTPNYAAITLPVTDDTVWGDGNLIAANNDPLLGDLVDNGGLTLTHAPLAGSPAIDAGDDALTAEPYDQRGAPAVRLFDDPNTMNGPGGIIDIGAVEFQITPRVTGVILSKTHSPTDVQTLDFQQAGLLGGASQLAAVPLLSVDRVTLAFDNLIDTTTLGDLTFVDEASGDPEVWSPIASGDSLTATWAPDGVQGIELGAGRWEIRLADTAVQSTLGAFLDGEWVNPLEVGGEAVLIGDAIFSGPSVPGYNPPSTVSGDGGTGGDFRFFFNVTVPGDFDGDGDVDTDDFGVFADGFQNSPTGGPPFHPGDFDRDVDVDDFGVFVNSFQIYTPGENVLALFLGDYNDDGFVDELDQTLFDAGFAAATDLSFDLTGDGDFTTADQDLFTALRDLF